ncbi:hypothetical protein [Geomesophilobacter sediminis]|uniref:Uncharacterized protein n=1 Tax=Geomesophilobacter sediminis TaxID=2798584 RepID=A0A8J7JEI1_9BACT|nr:hypothetical protein [Geomesophilobacter sediminis]MBJ6724479.1 hypothetical protein [Geomesophilobacter sediminis]
MKIYLFDPETGIYQGEDFCDPPSMTATRELPSGTTTVSPPSYGPGLVPVFREGLRSWELVSNMTLKAQVRDDHERV